MKFDFNDIIGKKFGKLTVLKLDHSKPIFLKNGIRNGKRYFYLCRCDCGNTTICARNHLMFYHSLSCGCITAKHHLSNSRLFKIYFGIKQRCYNPKMSKFKVYGGRGIKICAEWLNDFKAFYNWSMSHGYAENLSIDRIDVNGNYEPNNCRWVDMKTQQRNRTNNHLLTYNNKTCTINEWAEILNIKRETLKTRLHLGWSIEKALTTPVRYRNPK